MDRIRISLILCVVVFFSVLVPASASAGNASCYDLSGGHFPGGPVQAALAPGGRSIAAVVPDTGIIALYSVNGSPLWAYQTGDHPTGIAISRDGRFIAASTYAGDLYFLDTNGTLLWKRSGLDCDSEVFLTANGTTGYLVNYGWNSSSRINHLNQFHRNGMFSRDIYTPFYRIHPTPDWTYFAGAISDNETAIGLSSGDGTPLWTVPYPFSLTTRDWLYDVTTSDDASTIAAVKDHGFIIINHEGRVMANITPKYLATSIAVSPDGRLVAAGTQYKVLVYEPDGTPAWNFTLGDYIWRTAFSGDSRYLAAASENMVYFFDRNGTLLWKSPYQDAVTSLSVSRDGNVIVAGTANDSIYLFNRAGNSSRIDLKGIHPSPLPAAVEAPGGSPASLTPVPSLTVTPPTTRPAALPFVIPLGALAILFVPGVLVRKRGER
jgi:WD40 repeat protein